MNNNDNTYTYNGRFVRALEPKVYGQRGNKLREFWVKSTRTVETRDGASEREETVAFKTFSQKLVVALDDIRPGAPVAVRFRLSGREWQGRIFADLVADGVEAQSGGAQTVRDLPLKGLDGVDDGNIPF